MKKLLLSALIAATTLTAGAKSYVIYGTPGEGDVQGTCTVGSWGHTEYTDEGAPGGKKIGLSSGEWYAELPCTIDAVEPELATILNTDATLEFYIKTQVSGNLTLTVKTFGEDDAEVTSEAYTFTNLDTQNEWQKLSVNIHDFFPEFANAVKEGQKVQLPIFTGGFGQWFYLEFAEIRIVEGKEVVAPAYGSVYNGTAEAVTAYDGKDYVVRADYSLTANQNGTLTANVNCRGFENIAGLVGQVKFPVNEFKDLNLNSMTGSATSEATYELGQRLENFQLHFPYANGGDLYMDINDYIYGKANAVAVKSEKAYLLNATITDNDDETATITYDLFKADADPEAEYHLFVNGEDKGVATGTFEITGLTEDSDLKFEIYAKSTSVEKPFSTSTVTLSLEAPKYYHLAMDGIVKNAYLEGEDASQARDLPLSLEFEIAYHPDQTLTFEMTVHGGVPVGLVPFLKINNFDNKEMSRVAGTNKWTINTGSQKYNLGENLNWLHMVLNYAGGTTGEGVFYFQRGDDQKYGATYNVGDENEADIYGEAEIIHLTLDQTEFKYGDTAVLNAYGQDANGHYVFGDDAFDFSVSGTAFNVEGNVLSAVGRGKATLTVSSGESKQEFEISCITSKNAANVLEDATNKDGYSFNYCEHTSSYELAFDGIDNTDTSCLVWNCGETQEHYFEVDFGKDMNLEVVEIHWDGAGPKAYQIFLLPEDGEKAEADFSVQLEDAQAGGNYKGWHQFVTDLDNANGVTARKLRIETTEAYNAGWGIKITELRALGTEVETNDASDIFEIHYGSDNTSQSEGVDKGEYDIWVDSRNDEVVIYVKAPEGSDVYYKYSVNRANDEGYEGLATMRRAAPAENEEHQASLSQFEEGYHEIILPNQTSGTLTVRYENANDGSNGTAVYTYNAPGTNDPTSVEGIEATEEDAEYFNLQGVRVENPTSGIYIRRTATKSEKVIIR